MTLDKIKTISDIVAAWVGLAALVIGGIFAAYQFLQKESDDRVKATLDLIGQYNKSPLIDSRVRLEEAWRKHENQYDAVLSASPFLPSALDAVVLDVTEKGTARSDLHLLLGFYESVEICVRRLICDSTSAISFLQNDARSMYNLHFPYIEVIRKKRNDPTFAIAVEQFAKRSPAK